MKLCLHARDARSRACSAHRAGHRFSRQGRAGTGIRVSPGCLCSRAMDIVVPDPPLSDGLVTLRPWAEWDVDALVAGLDGDPEISKWLELIPQPYREPEAKAWIAAATGMWREGTAAPFAVTANGEVVAGCGVNWIDREQ